MLNKSIMLFFVMVGLAAFAFVAEAQVVQDGLVSYWSFEGGDVADRVGDNNGTIVGDPEVVAGKIGDALKFDGDDTVTFPTTGVPTGNSPMSWSAWFKREVSDGGGVQYIATYGFPHCCGRFFGIGTRGGDHEVTDGGAVQYIATYGIAGCCGQVFMTQWGGGFDVFGPVVSLGDWHHVVAVYNGSQNDTIYLNGEEVASQDLDEAPNYVDTNPGAIGSNPDLGEFYEGLIDDVGLYNRALSADDVAQNFLATVAVEPAGKLTSTWADIKSTK
jgi:hypothetical protein